MHAYSALLNEKMAREARGRFLLRIEDIDTLRCTPKLTTLMLSDLAWLGLHWEEPVLRQSEHLADYHEGTLTDSNMHDFLQIRAGFL